jgi:hypothetical protein
MDSDRENDKDREWPDEFELALHAVLTLNILCSAKMDSRLSARGPGFRSGPIKREAL